MRSSFERYGPRAFFSVGLRHNRSYWGQKSPCGLAARSMILHLQANLDALNSWVATLFCRTESSTEHNKRFCHPTSDTQYTGHRPTRLSDLQSPSLQLRYSREPSARNALGNAASTRLTCTDRALALSSGDHPTGWGARLLSIKESEFIHPHQQSLQGCVPHLHVGGARLIAI